MTFTGFSESRQNPKVVVTGDTPYLTIDTLLDVVVKGKFPLLSLDWYLFNVASVSGYLSINSN